MDETLQPTGSTVDSTGRARGDSDLDLSLWVPKPAAKAATRPDEDQVYLVARIADETDTPELSIRALQKLNTRFGRPTVTSALRLIHGWPPEVRQMYPYLEAVCRSVSLEKSG